MSKYVKPHSLAVGFNPKSGQDFFDILSMYEDYIYEYFFDLSNDIAGNALDPNHEYSILEKCDTYNFPANLLFNNYFSMFDYREKINAVKKLVNLKSVTLLNPVYAKQIKEEYPELEVHLSVRFWDWGRFTDPIARVKELADGYIDVINVSGAYSYNDFAMMKLIHDYGMKVKFIVNEGCIIRKDFNYSQLPGFEGCMCRTNPFITAACFSQCHFVHEKYPWMELCRNNLYKESLKYYDIDILKISGRHRSPSKMIEYLNYWTSDDITRAIHPSWHTSINVIDHYDAFLEYIDERVKCSGYCNQCRKCEKFFNIFMDKDKS